MPPADGAGRHPLVAELERLRADLAAAQDKISNLEAALATSREIGAAIGVLMTRYGVTKDAAFDMLRMASQHTHKKLREVAADVLYTGTLELSELENSHRRRPAADTRPPDVARTEDRAGSGL